MSNDRKTCWVSHDTIFLSTQIIEINFCTNCKCKVNNEIRALKG